MQAALSRLTAIALIVPLSGGGQSRRISLRHDQPDDTPPSLAATFWRRASVPTGALRARGPIGETG